MCDDNELIPARLDSALSHIKSYDFHHARIRSNASRSENSTLTPIFEKSTLTPVLLESRNSIVAKLRIGIREQRTPHLFLRRRRTPHLSTAILKVENRNPMNRRDLIGFIDVKPDTRKRTALLREINLFGLIVLKRANFFQCRHRHANTY